MQKIKNQKCPILVIVGPTGVGKTALSIALAKAFQGEIINADSMQVYRGLNIGTAKVTEKEKENIPHHLFDVCDVEDFYTVYDYQKDAREKIREIEERGHTPILVGGTGLYLKAALYRYDFQKESVYDDCRDKSNEEIMQFLEERKVSHEIHIHNRKRLIRLYNRVLNHNLPTNSGNEVLYDFICIGLTAPRDQLYRRINERVDQMIQNGLMDEVRSFYDQNIRSKALQTGIGYKEWYDYFDGDQTLSETIAKIKQNSRHYAKRQYTFFRHQLPVTWFEVNYNNFQVTIDEIKTYCQKQFQNKKSRL